MYGGVSRAVLLVLVVLGTGSGLGVMAVVGPGWVVVAPTTGWGFLYISLIM
jgi:hypothetical protein